MDAKTKSRTRRWSGRTLDESIPDRKRAAEEFKVTTRAIRYWTSGKRGQFLAAFLEKMAKVYEAGGDLWRLAEHVKAAAKWIVLRGKSTAELVERYHILVDGEHDFEARQNRAIQEGTASDIVAAAEAHASRLTEIAAVRFELDVRGVNPRSYRRADR